MSALLIVIFILFVICIISIQELFFRENWRKAVLLEQAKRRDWWVRKDMAEHPFTPKSVLKILATNKDSRIRDAVKFNQNANKRIIKIAKNTDKLHKYLD